jgi:hypothetical protein
MMVKRDLEMFLWPKQIPSLSVYVSLSASSPSNFFASSVAFGGENLGLTPI